MGVPAFEKGGDVIEEIGNFFIESLPRQESLEYVAHSSK